MKRTFMAVGLALSFGLSSPMMAQAKTPPEVLESYKAYRAALEAGRKSAASEYAYDAWKAAEDLMGDAKITGDLALNFAVTKPRNVDEKPAWKEIMRAYKRAIDLSHFYGADAGQIEIDRRTQYLAWQIPNVSKKVSLARTKEYSSKRLMERIEKLGFQGSTFEAEAYSLSSQAAMMTRDWTEVLSNSQKAIEIFDARKDGFVSIYEYAVPIYLARAYAETDQPIDAALIYQGLMTKLEEREAHDNLISGDAYAEWLTLRDKVSEMETNDPRAVEVINFAVPVGRQRELSPLIRNPPVFPTSFKRGKHSGFVKVVYDLDEKGRVQNPEIISSTHKSLHQETLNTLRTWRYSPNLSPEQRKGVETTIRFDLMDKKGKRLPVDKEVSRR
ncbi:hypothetical protein GCM10011309_04390 [Litorimonas cladophorae]|uniref:TonB C-terminal domain-containing protein n=1 Tax=Litorimonas cladophorae TaxID=1220491 RepID=A0A918NBG6_9PROT|nr:TonB family protein [Litorimonas cladophorae]GGX58256.1 hypothetical protein GCM10011309_04390 [Litorimonas cladophorae]